MSNLRTVTKPPHVLILGGGFVALKATRALRRQIKRGEAAVTVVDRDNFFTMHGFIGEMVTGRIAPGNILTVSRRIHAPAQVHVGEIESIDLERKRVVTSRRLDGLRFDLDYDHLVLALGSGENLDAYPGLAEHAFRLKSFEDCFRLRNHVLEMFELADIELDPEERRRLLTFFVAGGGFSGSELAAELADFARRLTKREFHGIRRDECRVVIVHSGKTLLPELYGSGTAERRTKRYPGLVRYAMRRMEKLGVEVMLETRVVGATPNEVHLSSGERIPTRTIVSAVGSKSWPLLDELDVLKDERGRAVVDEYLRVGGRDDLWAGGDCAAVPHKRGGTCPPVALYAQKHGGAIGRNIARSISGKPLSPFRSTVLGQGISIGNRKAVGEVKGIPVRGLLAWLMWRSIVWGVAVPSVDRRLRLLGDWAIWPIVGRDIVQMGSSKSGAYDVRQHVYQAGEMITDSARPARLVHVIVEGNVDLFRRAGEEEELLETIGPGGHFGRKALEHKRADTARASSALVRTLALRENQANQLQDALLSTGRIVARTSMMPTVDLESLRRQSAEEDE
jgi:NADH dehydrogenase